MTVRTWFRKLRREQWETDPEGLLQIRAVTDVLVTRTSDVIWVRGYRVWIGSVEAHENYLRRQRLLDRLASLMHTE